ncbi:MAG: hypothetical protein AAF497_21785, partial [Planctomycetota bacterium]
MHEHDHNDYIPFPQNWQGGFYANRGGMFDNDPNQLTVILDFNDTTQGVTTDGIGNQVSTFNVAGYGFSSGDFDLVASSVLAKVQEHYHDITVNLPSGEQLDIEFELGDIGTPPINGSNDYYYMQIGSRVASGGPLGQASLNSIRDSSGNPGAAVGSVVGSVFTDNINGLSSLTPSNALTSGNLEFTTNAIAGTTSHEIGHALSLLHIDKSGTITPGGLPPIMGTGAIDLPNQDRILDRNFSLSGPNAQDGGSFQFHVDQLESAVDTHESALPFNLSSADIGDAHLFPAVGGEIVDDTFEGNAIINFNGDVDGAYYAPQRSGDHLIVVNELVAAIDPIVGVYDAETGAKLSFNDDLIPIFNDNAFLSMPMDAFDRYIIAVADVGSDDTGEVEVTIDAPGTSSIPRTSISVDAFGLASAGVSIGNGDIDAFEATVPFGSTELRLELTDRTFDAAVVAWDSSGNELGRVDNGSPRVLNLSGLTAGDDLVFTVSADNFASTGTATMELDFGITGFPFTTTTAEQDAFEFPALTGDIVDDTTANFDLNLNVPGDVDSVFYSPQFTDTYTIDVGDFGNGVDPVVAVYDSSGTRIAFDDDSGLGDDAQLVLDLNQHERYVIVIADQGLNTTGDVSLTISTNQQTFRSTIPINAMTGDGGRT